jgi:hypothetical protein
LVLLFPEFLQLLQRADMAAFGGFVDTQHKAYCLDNYVLLINPQPLFCKGMEGAREQQTITAGERRHNSPRGWSRSM